MKVIWRVVFLTWHDINWWSLNLHFTMLPWISSHIWKNKYVYLLNLGLNIFREVERLGVNSLLWDHSFLTLLSVGCYFHGITVLETTVFWQYFQWVTTFRDFAFWGLSFLGVITFRSYCNYSIYKAITLTKVMYE